MSSSPGAADALVPDPLVPDPLPLVAGVDVGGTTIKGVVLGPDGRVCGEHRVPTPAPDPTGERVADAVAAVVEVLAGLAGLATAPAAVGVALPGVVDEEAGRAVQSVNVGWTDVPMRALLEQRLGPRVALGHDVRAGAVAEVRTGAARGVDGVVAFVPVGTGISAAVLVDGRPLVSGGWAGEIGQLVLAEGPFAGLRVEQVASAAATARRAGEPDARAVATRARAGDVAAREVWQQTVDVLAGALAGLVATVAPSAVVIGGGLALAGDLLMEPLRTALELRLTGLRLPRLVPAAHGDAAGALGAAYLAQDLARDLRHDPLPAVTS